MPRHLFVHPAYRALPYTDNALPTLAGMTTTAPSVVGFMIHQAGIRPGHRVLEVGTGTGYQAGAPYQAILLGAAVAARERLDVLARQLSRHGGRLVAPVGRARDQELLVLTRRGETVHTHVVEGLTLDFVRLQEQSG